MIVGYFQGEVGKDPSIHEEINGVVEWMAKFCLQPTTWSSTSFRPSPWICSFSFASCYGNYFSLSY